MKLSQLAAKPQLIKITLDDEATVAEYGEHIDFWTWDRQPLDVFMRLSQSIGTDQDASLSILKTLVLDAEGNQVIQEGYLLPTKVMVAVLGKTMDFLGK
jgi:hypothetical protein